MIYFYLKITFFLFIHWYKSLIKISFLFIRQKLFFLFLSIGCLIYRSIYQFFSIFKRQRLHIQFYRKRIWKRGSNWIRIGIVSHTKFFRILLKFLFLVLNFLNQFFLLFTVVFFIKLILIFLNRFVSVERCILSIILFFFVLSLKYICFSTLRIVISFDLFFLTS